jgi:hypothetical protein
MGGTLTELARPTVAKWAFVPASNFVIPALGLVITALNFVIPALSRDPEHMTGVRKEQQCGLDPGSSTGMTSL